jgi:hypothetical protein
MQPYHAADDGRGGVNDDSAPRVARLPTLSARFLTAVRVWRSGRTGPWRRSTRSWD